MSNLRERVALKLRHTYGENTWLALADAAALRAGLAAWPGMGQHPGSPVSPPALILPLTQEGDA